MSLNFKRFNMEILSSHFCFCSSKTDWNG